MPIVKTGQCRNMLTQSSSSLRVLVIMFERCLSDSGKVLLSSGARDCLLCVVATDMESRGRYNLHYTNILNNYF